MAAVTTPGEAHYVKLSYSQGSPRDKPMSRVIQKGRAQLYTQKPLLRAGNPGQLDSDSIPAGQGVRLGGHRASAIQMYSQHSTVETVGAAARGPDGPH